jgi:hypothetical protein
MRVGAVQLSEVTADGGRLTAGFHLSEDQVAVARLRRIADRCEPLRQLCLSRRGIFRGPIFRRVFVEDPARGEPYVSSSDLMQAHVEPAGYLSRKHHGGLLDDLRLHEGMILLTCSGMNLGSAIWTRRDMDGLCATHDLIRIQPDPERVPPGYLYAFLAGRYGHAWIRKQIYGGSIKHVEPEQVAGMPVPRHPLVERQVADLMIDAAEWRASANELVEHATQRLFASAGLEEISTLEWRAGGSELGFSARPRNGILRALSHSPRFISFAEKVRSIPHVELGSICADGHLGTGVRFRRIDASPDHGVRLVGQREGFWIRPDGRWISAAHAPDGIFAQDETVMIASSGTLGEKEVYCKTIFVSGDWLSYAYTQHFFRVVSSDLRFPGAYLYAFLRSYLAFRLLRCMSTGSKQQELHRDLISRLPIPLLDDSTVQDVCRMVRRAHALRDDADRAETAAITQVENAIEGGG